MLVIYELSLVASRLKNQRKAAVTAVDKKVPNGILEEQGNIVPVEALAL